LSYIQEGDIISSIPISNTFLVKANKSQIRGLASRADVVEIFSNKSFKVELPEAVEEQKTSALGLAGKTKPGQGKNMIQWNIQQINAPKVWAMDQEKGRGGDVIYASADTGVSYLHPILSKNYKGRLPNGQFDHNYNWYDGVREKISTGPRSPCGYRSPVPCDDQGHGTHVMSTAVGSDGFGVAPDARWIACRNMDNGVGSPETYLNCLNFFLAPHDLQGNNPDPAQRPHVVGNSYGCPDSEGCSPHAMTAAMEALRAAGIFMSVSAGNNGPACGTITDPPAIEPLAFSVGAVDRNDRIAPFSSRGPVSLDGKTYIKPDICAPGVDINAAIGNNSYRKMSGTSMATPHIAGIIALMLSLDPALDFEGIKAILQASCTTGQLKPPASGVMACSAVPWNDFPASFHYGSGLVDASAAIQHVIKNKE